MPGGVIDPEVVLAIAYAPAAARPGLRALWALDTRLAELLRGTRDPALGQLRFKWWHDAVAAPEAAPRGEPVLAALRDAGLSGTVLTAMVEGWAALLDGADDAALDAYARGRGGGLFAAAATILGSDSDVADAGAGWALVDLARHSGDPAVATRALALGGERLARAPRRWTRALRPLGMLAKLARRDLDGVQRQGSPRRMVAMAALALTGR
ncbi:MAG: squalene/phytoene synthase family protein [Pseudomonadota bacterium]